MAWDELQVLPMMTASGAITSTSTWVRVTPMFEIVALAGAPNQPEDVLATSGPAGDLAMSVTTTLKKTRLKPTDASIFRCSAFNALGSAATNISVTGTVCSTWGALLRSRRRYEYNTRAYTVCTEYEYMCGHFV